MCKIIVFVKAPHSDNPKKQKLLFNKLLKELSTTEHDGLGIAYIGTDGLIHRRRWASSEDFKGLNRDDLRAPFCKKTSEPVDETPATGFVLMHGRTATSAKGLNNAHPHMGMDEEGSEFALIHNGTVTASEADKAALGSLMTGCDSELILAAWMAGGMEKVSEIIKGTYAFAVIVTNPDGTKYLHVVKDNQASLFSGCLKDGSYIFATNVVLLLSAGGDEYAKVEDSQHLVFNPAGELIGQDTIPAPKKEWEQYQHGTYGNGVTHTMPPVPTQAPLALGAPGEHGSPVMASATDESEEAYVSYMRECGFDKNGDPLPDAPNPDVPASELKKVAWHNMDPAKIERKIAKGLALMDRLKKTKGYGNYADPAHAGIEDKLSRAAARVNRLRLMLRMKLRSDEPSPTNPGISPIHGLPNSEDEAQALRVAEREAAGVAPPRTDESPTSSIDPFVII